MEFIKRPIVIIFTVTVLLIVVVGGIIAAILANRPKEPVPITLTIWGLDDQTFFDRTFEQFKTKYPFVTISYKKQRLTKYRERVVAPEAQANEPKPDIFMLHNTWTPMLKNDLAPLPETILTQAQYETIFYPTTKKDLKRGNAYYGMPLSADGLAMYINPAMLKTKDVAIPTQWEELMQAATILSHYSEPDERGNKTLQIGGAGIGTSKNVEYFSDIIGTMLLQVDLDVGKLAADPEAASTIEYYTKFSTGKEAVWNDQFENSITSFAKEKVGIIFAPANRAPEIKTKNANLTFTTAPIPQLKPYQPVAWASYWAWGVSSTGANPALAWELVWSLESKASLSRANQRRIVTTGFGLPYPRTDMADRQKSDAILGAFILQAPYAASQPLANGTRDNGLNDKLIAELSIAVNRIRNGNAPRVVLNEMAQKVNPLLEENGIKVELPK